MTIVRELPMNTSRSYGLSPPFCRSQIEALPCDSYGRTMQINPANRKSAPLVYTGAEVLRSAAMAIMGAILRRRDGVSECLSDE